MPEPQPPPPSAGRPDLPPPPGGPPARDGRQLTLADLPPHLAERLRFDRAAPRRLRNDALPAEVRDELRKLWDGAVADVVDELTGLRRTKALRREHVQRALRRIADRVLHAQQVVILAGVHRPFEPRRGPGHASLAAASGGGGALASELAAIGSFGTAAAVSVLTAATSDVLETYLAASSRSVQYRQAGRPTDTGAILADLAEAHGETTLASRRATLGVIRQAAASLADRLVPRVASRFTRGIVPVVGVGFGAGASALGMRRLERLPLRPMSETEVMAAAEDILTEQRDDSDTRPPLPPVPPPPPS
jgi:hypothetical protein